MVDLTGNRHVPVFAHGFGCWHGKVLHDVEQMRRRHVTFELHHGRTNARDALLVVHDDAGFGSIAAGPAVPCAAVYTVGLGRRGSLEVSA